MAQPEVVIVDAEEGQRVGSQLEAILRRERCYRISLVDGCAGESSAEAASGLVVPVLPEAREKAGKLLAALRSWEGTAPFLPVVHADLLHQFSGEIDARDFLVTPLRESEVCVRVRWLAIGRQETGAAEQDACALGQIVGEDDAVLALKRKLVRVAQFEPTVLLTGETGTGKERCARALHYLSRRAGKPFLPVNCGAIPVDLFESELYGHHKGAFTSAVGSQPGLIAEAEGGTLYLDEIEALSLASQVKLLRFLQDHTYYPVGSSKARQANVWIVASTNVELPVKIQEGTFRNDLFYRLSVVNIALPTLRERRRDIPLLAAHFWSLYGPRCGRSAQGISPQVVEALCEYGWPGNVRELENVIQQIAVLMESDFIRPQDLPIPLLKSRSGLDGHSFTQRKSMAIEQFERSYVAELLRTHQGNITHAAREAQKDRRAFGRLAKKYGLAG